MQKLIKSHTYINFSEGIHTLSVIDDLNNGNRAIDWKLQYKQEALDIADFLRSTFCLNTLDELAKLLK